MVKRKRYNDLQNATHKYYTLSIRNLTRKEEKTGGELSSCSTSGTRRDKYLICWYRLVQI
jgi:hypothetical protein